MQCKGNKEKRNKGEEEEPPPNNQPWIANNSKKAEEATERKGKELNTELNEQSLIFWMPSTISLILTAPTHKINPNHGENGRMHHHPRNLARTASNPKSTSCLIYVMRLLLDPLHIHNREDHDTEQQKKQHGKKRNNWDNILENKTRGWNGLYISFSRDLFQWWVSSFLLGFCSCVCSCSIPSASFSRGLIAIHSRFLRFLFPFLPCPMRRKVVLRVGTSKGEDGRAREWTPNEEKRDKERRWRKETKTKGQTNGPENKNNKQIENEKRTQTLNDSWTKVNWKMHCGRRKKMWGQLGRN